MVLAGVVVLLGWGGHAVLGRKCYWAGRTFWLGGAVDKKWRGRDNEGAPQCIQ